MTVIAFDGKTVAADKRVTQAGMARTITKIRRHGTAVVGLAGDSFVAAELFDWFVRIGAEPEKFPASARTGDGTMVVFSSRGVLIYSAGPAPVMIEDPVFAIGSGRDYAMAAMHLGKTAAEAVEVACLFDQDCGNGVDTLEL